MSEGARRFFIGGVRAAVACGVRMGAIRTTVSSRSVSGNSCRSVDSRGRARRCRCRARGRGRRSKRMLPFHAARRRCSILCALITSWSGLSIGPDSSLLGRNSRGSRQRPTEACARLKPATGSQILGDSISTKYRLEPSKRDYANQNGPEQAPAHDPGRQCSCCG